MSGDAQTGKSNELAGCKCDHRKPSDAALMTQGEIDAEGGTIGGGGGGSSLPQATNDNTATLATVLIVKFQSLDSHSERTSRGL